MPCACIDLYDWSLKFHKTWLSGLLYGWLQAWPAFPRKSFVRGGEYLWQRRTPRKRYKLFWFPRKYEEKLRCQTLEKSQVSPALFLTTDPRRPRGSQSGREKRSDESSQAQAEKPLGIWTVIRPFPNSQANAGSWLGTKMFCIIVPNRRTASPEFFSCVRTRWLLSCHSCPVRSPKSAWFSSPHWKTLSSKGHFTLAILNNSDGVLAVNKNWLGKNVVGNCACHFSGRFYFF